MSVLDLARPEIRTLQPYSSARMEAGGGQIMLNANESAWEPVGDAGSGCNRYPDPQPAPMLQALAKLYGVQREQLCVGRGSDEAIDLLVRAFCRAGQDAIVIQPPTFGMYAVCARIQNAAVIEVPLAQDFGLDSDALLAAITPAVKLVFLCTPNNPSGKSIGRDDIERMAQALAGKALLVVDEAYIEFSDAPSAIELIGRYEHVAVLRACQGPGLGRRAYRQLDRPSGRDRLGPAHHAAVSAADAVCRRGAGCLVAVRSTGRARACRRGARAARVHAQCVGCAAGRA